MIVVNPRLKAAVIIIIAGLSLLIPATIGLSDSGPISFSPLKVLIPTVQSSSGMPERLWSINLRSLPQIGAVGALSEAGGHSVTFLDQNRLAFGLKFPASGPAVQLTSTPNFHKTLIVVVDSRTGNVESSRSWLEAEGGAYNPINMGHVNSGDLLLLRQDHLFLLSSALETVAERALDPIDLWYLRTDSSGNSALLSRTAHDNYDAIENHWISTRTLKDSRITPGVRGSLVVNGSVIFSPIIRPPYDSNSLKEGAPMVLDKDGQTSRLCSSCSGAAIAAFGHDFIVVAHHPGSSYSVLNARGEVIFSATHGGESDGALAASTAFSTSNRIALQYGHIDGAHQTSEDTLIVFDADKCAEIVRTNLSYLGQTVGNRTTFTTPRIALSPDGKFLAVMGADTLQVLKIP